MTPAYAEFENISVLVTGAAAGIGRAITKAFLAQGARVAALDLDTAGLKDTLAGASPDQALALTCDVTDVQALELAFAAAGAALGFPSVLINNAGVDDRRPVQDMTITDWRHALAVNLDHHFVLSQLAGEHMAAMGGGAIVNLSSTAWMKLAPNLSSYHAAKAGIVGLTRGLAREFGPALIRVNAIAPGRVVTEKVRQHYLTPAWEAETRVLQCLPVLIEPDDIAQAALWLASSGSRLVTGQTIVIDGGVV